MNNNTKLFNSGKTIFRKKDIDNILNFKSKGALDKFVYRAKKEGYLKNPFYGLYSLGKYNIFELATKIKNKSYISLETVLKKEAVIFQYYSDIFLISDDTLEKNIDGQKFGFKKIKDSILLNPLGIINEGNYMIASRERAICDRLYLSKNYHFDNLENVNFEKLSKLSKIYNKRVILEVNKLIQNAK